LRKGTVGAPAGSRRFDPGRFALLFLKVGSFPAGLLTYSLVQRAVEPRHSFETALDRAIPFVPWMVVVYLAFFPFVAVSPFLVDRRKFATGLLACVFAMAVAWPVFLLVPASVTRPDPGLVQNEVLRAVFRWLQLLDDTHNTFPSLHVAIVWICAIGATRWVRHGWAALPLAVAVSASTTLVKQHAVADVVAGTALGLASFLLAEHAMSGWRSRHGPGGPGPKRGARA
jgi:membrane-associated phospholipid phosphatase